MQKEGWETASNPNLTGHFSPLRLFAITIAGIFTAEVVAMIVVKAIRQFPYYQITLIDAGIMLILIFPILYLFSFRPLIQHIQKLQRVEHTLQQKEELQERFFDSIDILIAYMDREFNFIRVNDAYARADGRAPEFFVAKNHFALYPHPENEALFRHVVETGEAYVVYEKPFEYPENPERGVTYWDWGLQPVRSPDGTSVDGVVLSLVDVTERKRAEEKLHKAYDELELRVQERTEELRLANIELKNEIAERKLVEEALRESEQKYSAIFDKSPFAISLTKMPEGTIVSVNDAFLKLFEYQHEEVIGKTSVDLGIADPDSRAQVAVEIQKRGSVQGFEVIRTTKTNSRRVLSINLDWVSIGGEKHILTTSRDVTERKRAEEALRAARDELELRVQERTKELADTNRDLLREINERERAEREIRERNQKETMLTQAIHTLQLDIARDLHDTVGQNISYLRMKLDHLSEADSQKSVDMKTEIVNMSRVANESYDLIRGMLALLQSESSADLSRLLSRYAQQIEERSSFRVDFSSQGEPRVLSPKRMRQLFYIIREILSNIEKHANASHVCMEMTWDEECLCFVITDNGGGFDPNQFQYGSRYGLKFMRERADLLNGSLTINSVVGSGTNIVLQIPYE